MNDDSLHQPHDKLFRSNFSDLPTAREFLKEQVGEEIAAATRWETLRLEPSTFIDNEMKFSSSDLLYAAEMQGGESLAFFYILLEHQLQQDPMMVFRLLCYMVQIWQRFVKQYPTAKTLPPIIPIVVSQAKQEWRVARRFQDLIAAPSPMREAMRKYTPDFEAIILELVKIPFDKIIGTSLGIMTLRVLKAQILGDLVSDEVWDEVLLIGLPPGALERLLRYLLDRDIDKETFQAKIHKLSEPKLKDQAMTLAQQYRQEGRQEGRIRAMQKSIRDVLEARFERVPQGLSEAVEGITDPEHLSRLLRRASICPDLEAFAEEL